MFSFLLRAGLVMTSLSSTFFAAEAQPPEVGVSHSLAIARAARLSDLHYGLTYTLVSHAHAVEATEIATFTDSGSGDLAIDFRDGALASATLNGKAIAVHEENGHLMLPGAALLRGQNKLETAFTANIAAAGKAITRYQDKDDGNEYLYTLFVPMDADMAFPCFDQPDLKARFTLIVNHPGEWTVIGNTAPSSTTPTSTTFAETRPISTYLFAFAAGPFQHIGSTDPKAPAIYVRASQLKRAQAEATAVQDITARGIHYLEDFFQQPFPFPKYDLVLIPGFPFGGMEHAGATFLNEDGVLFRTAPTQSDYFRRNTLLLHETTHQWFGDLVTMRWFDDLWLKEGFAQYMAYKALAALEPDTLPWKHFYEDIKPLAYGIDETQGTTPIFQNIPNLKDAKSAYGAIVYQKAPAILKQLNYKLGDDVFRDGLRLYLKQHAYANAQWADLIGAFTQAGGKDVQAWANAWVLQRGMPQVDASFTCSAGKLKTVTLTQHDVLPDGYTWPISNELLLSFADGSERRMRVDWAGATHAVVSEGRCPGYVFANSGDYAYGRFLLDATSEQAVTQLLNSGTPPIEIAQQPLLDEQLWGAIWEDVRLARTAPLAYVQLARPNLFVETDESQLRVQGSRVSTALHAYLGPESKREVLDRIEGTVLSRMTHGGTLGVRIVSFRTFIAIAESTRALGVLKDLLSGSLKIEGMPLKPLDRWNIIGHLIAMSDPDAPALLAAEQKRDPSGEGLKYAYAVQAGTPDAAAKQYYWEDYMHNTTRQEDWITQSLGAFNSWNQASLTEPYLTQALDQLPEIKLHRKIFFLGAWLGSFIGGQHTPEAQAAVHAWLARKDIDPDLRLKVLEASDALDRTVLIRKTFPE